MPSALADTKRLMLDEALRPWRTAASNRLPRGGWLKTIRTALGMTTQQAGTRLGVSQSRMFRIEQAEADGSLSLKNLRDAANGGARVVGHDAGLASEVPKREAFARPASPRLDELHATCILRTRIATYPGSTPNRRPASRDTPRPNNNTLPSKRIPAASVVMCAA